MLLCLVQSTAILLVCFFQTLVPNYYLVVISLFLLGLVSAPRFNIGMMYGLEFTTKEYQKAYSLVAQIGAGCQGIFIGIEFMFYKNMVPGAIAYSCFNLFLCLMYYCYVPESPYFLFKKGQYEKFYQALEKMARYNNCLDFNIQELKAL